MILNGWYIPHKLKSMPALPSI